MTRAFVLTMVAMAGCASGWDGTETPHHYDIPGYGTLTLDLPAGVTETISSGSGDDALYITLGTRIDDPVLAVRVRLLRAVEAGLNRPERILQRFEENEQTLIEAVRAAETDLEFVPLGEPDPRGYYYVTTDTSHEPDLGEYRFMMVGELGADELLVRFTVLTNDAESANVRRALAALAGVSAHRT